MDAAQLRAATLPRPWVFTNGVFDVLHRGHVTYLAQARALVNDRGGSLIVAVNTDASARRLGKGPERPLNSQEDRMAVLAALESVSAVTCFDEDTPLQLIQQLRPDVIVKGGDYAMETLPEVQWAQDAYGAKAYAIDFLQGFSTTRLVEKIRATRS